MPKLTRAVVLALALASVAAGCAATDLTIEPAKRRAFDYK